MPRSFIAIETNEETRKNIIDLQRDLKQTGADLKIVNPENIHLTLRFLGNVSENRLELVKDAMNKAITISPFKIGVEGTGVFPKLSFIRVIWAGVEKGEEETRAIRDSLDKKLDEINHPPPDKEFTPHLTIARVKSGKAKDKLISKIKENSDREFGSINVTDITLKKSELTPDGPIYTTLERISLD